MPSSGVKTCALRSEEHTSELQSHDNFVCRLLLEKKEWSRDGGHGGTWARCSWSCSRSTPCRRGRRRSFFFNDTAPTEICPLSLHDALPISRGRHLGRRHQAALDADGSRPARRRRDRRSEEHTSELQSHDNLVCRLLLE